MRSAWVALVTVLAACRPADVPAPGRKPAVASASVSVSPAPMSTAAGPKPGERVRQPELDGYCAEKQRPAAFYYHGGNPAVRVARKDACAPLYLTECEAEGRCYPPRDQEPGMWCCGASEGDQPAAHATR
jgi:hypothetical protein